MFFFYYLTYTCIYSKPKEQIGKPKGQIWYSCVGMQETKGHEKRPKPILTFWKKLSYNNRNG